MSSEYSKFRFKLNLYMHIPSFWLFPKFLKMYYLTMFPKHFTPPSYTAFQALQRFSQVSEWLYNRPITWDRSSWQPRKTPWQKLAVWYFLSLIVPSFAINTIFILLRQLVSYQKDPNVSVVTEIFIILGSCGYTVAVSVLLTETFKSDEFRVMLKFLRKFQGFHN